MSNGGDNPKSNEYLCTDEQIQFEDILIQD